MKVRFRYSKLGKLRWTSQRDMARMWERALRKAAVPVAYTSGFSPRPKLSFGLALPTGCESLAEFLDVEVATPVAAHEVSESLKSHFPGWRRDHRRGGHLRWSWLSSAGRDVLRLGNPSPRARPPGARAPGGSGARGAKPSGTPRAQRARGGRRPPPSCARANRLRDLRRMLRAPSGVEHPSSRCAPFGAWAGSRYRAWSIAENPSMDRDRRLSCRASRARRSSAGIAPRSSRHDQF